MDAYKIPYSNLKKLCLEECDSFENTSQIEPLKGIIGQERAVKAIDFGLMTKKKGYNIYVSGLSGTGRNSYVKLITKKKAMREKPANDWVYVYNFKKPDNPCAIDLKPGQGIVFKKAIEDTIVILKKEIENAFVSKEYESMKAAIYKQFNEESELLINQLNEIASKYNFKYTRSEKGLVSVPLINNKPMTEEDLRSLTPQQYEELQKNSSELSLASLENFNNIKDLEDKYRKKLKELDSGYASKIVTINIGRLKRRFSQNKKIENYFNMLTLDIIENVDMFKSKDSKSSTNSLLSLQSRSTETFLKRYKINLFIDNSEKNYAPVVVETNPTYYNLLGSVEYESSMGVLKTDFMKVKPGTLHAANGGYIILQAKDVLANMLTWKGFLRSLQNEKIKIESMESQIGYPITSTLKPEPIPLKVKVILVGDPQIYSLLYAYDEQFAKLFKIRADFDVEMVRSKNNVDKMAKFISAQCINEGLRPFDRDAVCKIIEYSSRIAGNQKKLSSKFNQLIEILYEADTWADAEKSEIVKLKHVIKAIKEKKTRNNIYEEKIMEMFENGVYLLDVEGEKTGEINGLAVVGAGEYSFGKPSKITVATYRGKSGIINIEREAKTSGKIHDKGVMIINGYLGHEYAQDKPLALSASIVFEQLYSGVDGDSASSTELYAILSSLSEVPIKQSIAVTGSVNQRGQIQPIGGVNEKIEGYYKVCKLKGLTGKQGVIIPHQNEKDLMLDNEVIEAVKEGNFSIYSVKTINEGIEILTGIKAGERNEEGKFPENTIHYLVDKKLKKYADLAKKK